MDRDLLGRVGGQAADDVTALITVYVTDAVDHVLADSVASDIAADPARGQVALELLAGLVAVRLEDDADEAGLDDPLELVRYLRQGVITEIIEEFGR